MKTIAVYYATTEGQTSKIAEAIAAELSALGCAVHLVQSGEGPWALGAESYDGAILGASVHLSKYPDRFKMRVAENAERLRAIPVAFFSVCLGVLETDSEKTQEAEREIVRKFLEGTGIKPVKRAIFAGAIRYSKYGFLKRMLLHRIAKKAGKETRTDRDYEFTDWEEVKEFARDFVDFLDGKRNGVRKFPGNYRKDDTGGRDERSF